VDGNGIIDSIDYAAANACVSGPATPLDQACLIFDVVADGVIDMRDLGALLARFAAD
jgi:hypothetical protein